jgi:hypothetical protein
MAERIPIALILFPEPVSAGMDPYILMSLAGMYRKTNEDTTPIEVRKAGPFYRLTDGRHRVVASMIAGRKTIWALVEEDRGTQT